jgi:hypothetical protein
MLRLSALLTLMMLLAFPLAAEARGHGASHRSSSAGGTRRNTRSQTGLRHPRSGKVRHSVHGYYRKNGTYVQSHRSR